MRRWATVSFKAPPPLADALAAAAREVSVTLTDLRESRAKRREWLAQAKREAAAFAPYEAAEAAGPAVSPTSNP